LNGIEVFIMVLICLTIFFWMEIPCGRIKVQIGVRMLCFFELFGEFEQVINKVEFLVKN